MKRLIFVFSLLISQQTLSSDYTVYGFAKTSCGSWTSAREEKSAPAYQYAAWALGWVSGAGWAGYTKMAESDPEAILGWIDNYCDASPLDSLTVAIQALIIELERKEK